MGLAASQARFLAITSRKMACEFESMQIAQDKLSVTRDLQKASQEYQDSLNATKLVWDTSDDSVYDLSYALMTTPSMINEYNAYLLTDSSGRIVLSEAMFNAALAAGVINDKGDPTGTKTAGSIDATNDGSRNAFLYQLGVQNLVSTETINGIKNLGDTGYSASGVGGAILDKTLANVMNTNSFKSYLSSATYTENSSGTVAPDSTGAGGNLWVNEGAHAVGESLFALPLASLLDSSKYGYTDSFTNPSPDNKIGYTVTNNGNILSAEQANSLTLGDILNGEYVFTVFEDNQATQNGSANIILENIDRLLGGVEYANNGQYRGLYVDSASGSALEQAKKETNALLTSGGSTNSAFSGLSAAAASINATKDSFHVQTYTYNTGGGSGAVSSVNITNILNAYITSFAINLDGYDTGLYVDEDNVSESTLFSDNLDYQFITSSNSAVTNTDLLNADFYNQMYNNICLYGCSTDKMMQQKVTDSEYLNYALKNGQLFISSLNDDGYFYSDHYTLNGHVAEVQDDDAIAQAEAEYNVTKSKLDYKEQNLELKLKNIDTELSALTTEYDTVKNLISKNVEKVFTMFST